MWKSGAIKTEKSVIRYWIKQYEEGSEYGIDEGRISKLTLEREDMTIANYDRGWDLIPVDEEAERVLAILLKQFN